MKIIKFLLFISIIFSCKENKIEPSEKKAVTSVSSELILENRSVQNDVDEGFDEFFERFKIDSVFQLSRIADSVSVYSDYDQRGIEKIKYSKKRFSFYDYNSDTLAYKRDSDAFTIKIEKKPDSVTYYSTGYDNGINVFRVFKKNKEGKWFYCSLHDYSI